AFASYDELPYARLVAERFGTDHHEEVLEPNVAELLPTIVRHFDEPFADSSAVPTFAVAEATARLVKVALSGIGGDETFGGYPRYLGVRVDLATYLPDDLLVMADRMSMANSLELRAPFCDHRLVEASLAIPPSVKIPGRRLKGLLKTAFADVLPRPVLEHRKQGFMIPLGAWLTSDLRATLEDL